MLCLGVLRLLSGLVCVPRPTRQQEGGQLPATCGATRGLGKLLYTLTACLEAAWYLCRSSLKRHLLRGFPEICWGWFHACH